MKDPQLDADTRGIPLQRVGVQNIRLPVTWEEPGPSSVDLNFQTVAEFTLSASLASHQKGTHMSRFLQELFNIDPLIFSYSRIQTLLEAIAERLNCEAVFVTLKAPIFYKKKAPISGIEGWAEVQLEEQASWHKATKEHKRTRTVDVFVKSLCPCSKSISEFGAHNQRSRIQVTLNSQNTPSLLNLIQCVEDSASAALYSILKREDEKYITELAYQNPRFVEDLVRETCIKIGHLGPFDYAVEALNFESIHSHNVFARAERKQGAFLL